MNSKTKKILKHIFSIIGTIAFLFVVLVVSFTLSFYKKDITFMKSLDNCTKVSEANEIYSISEIDISNHTEIIQESLKKLPNNIRNMVNDEWTIVMSDKYVNIGGDTIREYLENLDVSQEEKDRYKVGGQALTQYKVIVIYTYKDLNEEEFMTSVIHEIGHSVSYEYGNMDREKEFITLFEKYKNVYVPNNSESIKEYASLNASEFFATVFADFILYPELLKTNQPDLYEYMEKINDLPADMNFFNKLIYGWNALKTITKEDFAFGSLVNTTN